MANDFVKLTLLLVILTLFGCAAAPVEKPGLDAQFERVFSDAPVSASQADALATDGSEALTPEELQFQVMAFADLYIQRLWQAVDEIRFLSDLPLEERTSASFGLVVYATAAIQIATGPQPAANLLDMVTFVMLSRMVMEEHWMPLVYGEQGQPLLESFNALEAQIWGIAAQVLTPAQQQQVRDNVITWRRDNPDQVYIAGIRLLEYTKAQASETEPAERQSSAAGFFANIEALATSVDESVLLAERMMFYMQKMPLLISLETQLMLDELSISDPVSRFLGNSDEVSSSLVSAVGLFEQFPLIVAREREATLRQLAEWLAQEESQLSALLRQMQSTLEVGNALTLSFDKTLGSLETLMAQFATPEGQPESPQRKQTLESFTQSVEELTRALLAAQSLLEAASLDRRFTQLSELMAMTEDSTSRLFRLAMIFLWLTFLVVLLGGLGALLCYRFIWFRFIQHERQHKQHLPRVDNREREP